MKSRSYFGDNEFYTVVPDPTIGIPSESSDREELKIRWCDADAPKIGQMMGIELRDYLRSMSILA